MRTDGESVAGTGDPFRALAKARRDFERGRIEDALDLLDRAVGRPCPVPSPLDPPDPPEQACSGRYPTSAGRTVDLLAAAVRIAILEERTGLARRWIGRTRKSLRRSSAAPDRSDLDRELDLLELRVRFAEEGPIRIAGKLEDTFSSIRDWRPWMLHFRWLVLLNGDRLDELREFVRRPPGPRIPKGTVEYAARLACLGIVEALSRRSGRAGILLRSALVRFEEVRGLEGLHGRAIALAWLARTTAEEGGISTAIGILDEASRTARRLRSTSLRWLIANTSAGIHYRAGAYAEALRANLDICLTPGRSGAYHAANRTMAFLNAARCALKLGATDRSRRLAARAGALVRAHPYPRLRSYLHIIEGDIRRETGTPAGFRDARRLYRLAEDIIRKEGGGDGWWLGQVHLSRGELHLREKDPVEALRQATLGMEMGRASDSRELQGDALLLKSFLLLEKKAPRLDIYERVIRQMGVIRDPVVLFKVIANLYIYTWDKSPLYLNILSLSAC